MNIIETNTPYTYDLFYSNLSTLKKLYPFLSIERIGSSILGKPILCIKLGVGKKQILYTASFHANEWITTPLLMKFIEDFSRAYQLNLSIMGYSVSDIFEDVSIFLVPLVNPDGVNLVTKNIPINNSSYQNAQKIATNYSHIPFPNGWKANINGVDLNLQFPADWEKAKEIKYSQGYTSYAPRDFVGNFSLTEPEAISLYQYTLSHSFRLLLTYHTQGKEIYWKYQDYLPKRSYTIAKELSKVSGYTLSETPYNSSFAGFKDWFISYYNLPGYTIEAGFGENPLSLSQFDEIYHDNLGILLSAAILA